MTIGIDLVAKASPDGHAMIIVNPSRVAMEFLKLEITRWGKAVKQAGVKIESVEEAIKSLGD